MKAKTQLVLVSGAVGALCAFAFAPVVPEPERAASEPAPAVAALPERPLLGRVREVLVGEAVAQQQPVDLAADWAKQESRAMDDAAKEYEKLFKWCVDKALENTGNMVRRKVLRYQPGNEEVRKYFGYMRTPDGHYVINDNRREQLRETVDIEDPKATDFAKKVAATDKKVVGFFKGLAQKAKKNASEPTEAANAAAWKEREVRSWNRVLEVDKGNEEAHKSLGHPKYEGRYVSPFALEFLKVRAERKASGLKIAQSTPSVKAVEPDGLFKAATLTGGGADSAHIKINTTYGKDVAMRLAQWAERALEDFCTMYAVTPEAKTRLPINRFDVVKDKSEHEKLLRSAGWDEPKIKKYMEHFSGMSAQSGEFSTHNSGQADADDMVMHQTGHAIVAVARGLAVQEHGSPNDDLEDWLRESISYDITRRLTGTTFTTCGAFGKYGNNATPRPNQDIWIELARMQVEIDDDVPLSRLWKLKIDNQEIRGPETVKGYAFVQYLFEHDAEKARKFVQVALAQGTPAAAAAVFGDLAGASGTATTDGTNPLLDALDAKYREWILKSW